MKEKRRILWAALAVVLAIALLAVVYLATRPTGQAGQKTFTVEVVHKNGEAKTFTYTTEAQFVGEVLLQEGLIAGDQGEYGLYVLTVDGEDAIYETDGAYWAFYENGDYAAQGVDQTPAVDGGSYGFVYTGE